MSINLQQFSNPAYANGKGFGQGAYDRARAAGYTDAQIKASLAGSGLTVAPEVASSLGANTDLYQYRGGGGQFGMGTLNNARAAGLTDDQIRKSLSSSGLEIGDDAAKALNVNTGYTYFGSAPYAGPSSYPGNSGKNYDSRPVLAPRGFGSSKDGYSSTYYMAGGTNDYDVFNTIFNQKPGTFNSNSNIGGGYSDPTFNEDNAKSSLGIMKGNLGSVAQVGAKAATNKTTKVGTNDRLKIGTNSKKTGSGSSSFKRSADRVNNSLTI